MNVKQLKEHLNKLPDETDLMDVVFVEFINKDDEEYVKVTPLSTAYYDTDKGNFCFAHGKTFTKMFGDINKN